MEKTKAIFFKHVKNKEVFALFTEIIEGYKDNIPFYMCYAHIGQHSYMHPYYLYDCDFLLTTDSEVFKLEDELRNLVGYNLSHVFIEDAMQLNLKIPEKRRKELRKEYFQLSEQKKIKCNYEVFLFANYLKL